MATGRSPAPEEQAVQSSEVAQYVMQRTMAKAA
jgi:hypothetical protein